MSKKGGDSTTNQPATATPQELRLQDVQANYAEQTAPQALKLQNAAGNMLWNNPGIVPVNYSQMGQQGANQAYGLQGQAANLGSNIAGLSGLNQSTTNQSNANLGGLFNLNGQNTANNAQTMQPLVNGQLPSSYADNQAYAINRGLQTDMGNLLANNAARGVINSSAMNTGVQGLSDSLANTLSGNYNQNMAQAATMQNQNYNQQQQGYQNYAGIADAQNNLGQQNFTNQQNVYNAQGNNLEQQRGLLSQPMELLNSAQNASIDIPNKLITMANGQQANTNDLWTNMAQQRIASTPQTTYAPSNGGLLGGIASGLGAYFGAKK
jgi:hypothetical protein